VDHSRPLRITEHPPAGLALEDKKAAIALAERSLDSWPDWAVPGGHLSQPPVDPEARPPF